MWGYTPRQIGGFVRLVSRRLARESAQSLSLNTMAARGDPKKVKEQIRKMERSAR